MAVMVMTTTLLWDPWAWYVFFPLIYLVAYVTLTVYFVLT